MNKDLKERIKVYIGQSAGYIESEHGSFAPIVKEADDLLDLLNRKKGRHPGSKHPRKINHSQSVVQSSLLSAQSDYNTVYDANHQQLPSISSLEVD